MGLRAIIRICGLGNREITISDVIFKIGPRINASGRMQSGKEAVDLLVSRDVARRSTATIRTARSSTNRSPKRPTAFSKSVAR